MSIYKKLLEIQKMISGLSKNETGHNYSYVTGNKILYFIRPKMDELGLLLKQEIISIDNTRIDYQTKNASKSEMHSKVMMRFTWIDSETGEKDVNEFGANGQNDWEKGLGSALTYAERYFLLKYFHIATDGDDVDNEKRPKSEGVPVETSEEKLNKATTLPELQKAYQSLSKEDKERLTGLKDELKTKLQNNGSK